MFAEEILRLLVEQLAAGRCELAEDVLPAEYEKDFVPTLANLMISSHHFRFDPEIRAEREHHDFWVELRGHGQFRLPFDSVWYEFTMDMCEGTQGESHTLRVGLLAAQLELLMGVPFGRGAGASWSDTQLLVMGGYRTVTDDGDKALGLILPLITRLDSSADRFQWAPLLHYPRMPELPADERAGLPPYVTTFADLITHHAHRSLCGLTVALMSPDIETVDNPEPVKLNRKRERAGKMPIVAYRTVRIRPDARVRLRLGERGSASPPRMHWRRGHFRRLADGRVVPVAPTIVGARENGLIIKDYAVTSAREGTDAPAI